MTEKIQLDEFEIEYGSNEEITNTSEHGFTDTAGDSWETWDDNGLSFLARRIKDGLTYLVQKVF